MHGEHDKLDEFRSMRDRAMAVFEEAARFPGQGGAPSPAAKEIPAIRAALDDQHAPEELSACVTYFDGAGSEGIEIELRRTPAKSPPSELVLDLVDEAVAGAVDGKLDSVGAIWSPGRVTIALRREGGQYVERVRVGEDASYSVTSPNLAGIMARAQTEIYDRRTGANFTRLVREGGMRLRARPAAPHGTSFPAP
jgi:hypothetical protein